MKLHVLRFIVVALACACAVMVISNLRAQKAAANEDEFGALYAAHVTQADQGCDFDLLQAGADTPEPEIH